MAKKRENSGPPRFDGKKKQTSQRQHRQVAASGNGQVFISYSRNDRDYVSRLAAWLEGHGVQVWFDHEIDYGARWEREIKNQLDGSSVVVVVMTKSAQRSRWVAREIERAKQQQISVLPLLLEPDSMLHSVADLQFENVSTGQMPGLRFCQKLPHFLVSEQDIADGLTYEQRAIAQRMASVVRKGSRGPGVAALQAELTRVGLDPGPINGVFGERTASALREFQRRRCLRPTVDGIAGPRIWAILASSSLGDLAPSTPAGKGR